MVNLLVWIPALPLIGALLILLFHRLPRRMVEIAACGTVLGSFLLAAAASVQLASNPTKSVEIVLLPWLAWCHADWGLLWDPLTAVMVLIITGVGFLVHVFSTGYMAHDAGYARYFGFLNLFVALMLVLVLANNYLVLFAGWEGVGLASYLLIGFDTDRRAAGDAARKAFLVNRVGDAALLVGLALLFTSTGSLRFSEVNAAGASTAAVFLLIGACGKSAQFPLHIWLPDAMEGPTPVSALIHAATMVTAGVYLVARSAPLFRHAPEVSFAMAIVGVLTALFAASVACVQTDIKRVLAYSTVSQLGYMFLALGVGAYWVAIFHLFTHAFFKALLFLGAGSIIHALNGEQDLRYMGGLKRFLPATFWTMLIGALALAGIPGLAGFFSKDEILWESANAASGSPWLLAIGLIASLLTAFYMGRFLYLIFAGQRRTSVLIHALPISMNAPLVVLALGSIAAGWIGVPKLWTALGDPFRSLEHWLSYVFDAPGGPGASAHSPDTGLEWWLLLASALIAFAGLAIARWSFKSPAHLPVSLHRALENGWYVDSVIHRFVVKGAVMRSASALTSFDKQIVDGGVNGAGWLTVLFSRASGWWDRFIVDGIVGFIGLTVRFLSLPIRWAQNGSVQAYALVFVTGLLAVLGYYVVAP